MREVLVREAAVLYDVGEERIRAMLRSGRLEGRKVGSTWLVNADPDGARPKPRGRPLSAANAWAVLAMLAGDAAAWVDPSIRSRLRRWMKDAAWVERVLRESQARAEIHRWRVLPNDLSKMDAWPGLVPTGLSAGERLLDVVGRAAMLDAYADARSLASLRKRFRPSIAPDAPNLVLRVPSNPWILCRQGTAPAPVVAADLLGHEDPRVASAAMRLLREHRP